MRGSTEAPHTDAPPSTPTRSVMTHRRLRIFGVVQLVVILTIYMILTIAATYWRRRRKKRMEADGFSHQRATTNKRSVARHNANSVSSSCSFVDKEITMAWPTAGSRRCDMDRFRSATPALGTLPSHQGAAESHANSEKGAPVSKEDLERACAEYTGSSSCFSPHFYTDNSNPFLSEGVQL